MLVSRLGVIMCKRLCVTSNKRKIIRTLQRLGRSQSRPGRGWDSDSGVQPLPADASDLVSWCTPAVGPTQIPVQGYWKFFDGVKRAWREIDYSSSSAEATKEWRCTSTPSAFCHARAGTSSTFYAWAMFRRRITLLCIRNSLKISRHRLMHAANDVTRETRLTRCGSCYEHSQCLQEITNLRGFLTIDTLLATGWRVRGSNPGGGEVFFTPSRYTLGPTQTPMQWVPCHSRR